MRLADPEVLIFETSPFRTLDAIVEHDGLAVYFYLNQPEKDGKFGTRACWVRNLEMGPMVFNLDEMQQGIPPQLPRTHCVNRDGQPLPQPDNLSIVWFEEGNGAALMETIEGESQAIAIIPPWSGLDGFHGYALECANENQVCWPMPDNPNLSLRIRRSQEFWTEFSDQNSPDSFATLQSQLLEYFENRFAIRTEQPSDDSNIESEYYRIDNNQFPPRGLTKMKCDDETVVVTIGVSLCPQPAVELFSDNPTNLRRFEIGIRIPNCSEEQAQAAIGQISKLAGYPWRNFTWLGDGHTCEFRGVLAGIENALLVNDSQIQSGQIRKDENQPLSPVPELPKFRDDPINLLWLIPITATQLDQLKKKEILANEVVNEYLANR